MYSASPRLRPLSLSELLDTTFALYRENFALFADVVAVLQVPLAVIDAFLRLGLPTNNGITTSGQNVTINGSDFAASASYTGISDLLGLIVGALITGALAWAIGQRYLGRSATIGGAYSAVGVGAFVTLLIATILSVICLVIGFLFLVVPFFILLVHWVFIPQAIVLERRGVFGAFGRSWDLVRGHAWRVFGYGIVVVLIVSILGLILGAIVGVIIALLHGGPALAAGVSAVVNIVVQPIELGAATLMYFDLRIRKEGFDLEQMARDLDSLPS